MSITLLPPSWPADALDTPDGRMIAADWWEERGEVEKAERLRQQIFFLGGSLHGSLATNDKQTQLICYHTEGLPGLPELHEDRGVLKDRMSKEIYLLRQYILHGNKYTAYVLDGIDPADFHTLTMLAELIG